MGKFNNYHNKGGGKGGNKNNNKKNKSKTLELKFHPQSNDPKTATFATIKEHIIQCAQRDLEHGYDVAKSLEEGELVTFEEPTLQFSRIDGRATNPSRAQAKSRQDLT